MINGQTNNNNLREQKQGDEMAKQRNRTLEPANWLKNEGYKKLPNGKYLNPLTNRQITKQSALDRSVKIFGWKDWNQYKSAYTSKEYQRLKTYAEAMKRKTGRGSNFDLLFKEAYQSKFKKRSPELTKLLTYVGKRNGKTKYAAGETPYKKRKRK